jgi:hypothetical protein
MRGDWLNRSQLCKVLAIDPTNFDKSWRPLIPDNAQRREGNRILFHVRTVIDAYIDREVEKRSPAPPQLPSAFDGDAEGLFLGQPTKWSERCQQLRAEDMELDLDVKRGNLIPREEIAELLARLASVLRPAGEKLQRDFGADAGQVYNEAVDEVERLVEGTAYASVEPDS